MSQKHIFVIYFKSNEIHISVRRFAQSLSGKNKKNVFGHHPTGINESHA